MFTIIVLGFNVESFQFRNLMLNVWDVGGQDIIRPLWKHYYQNTNAVIFVVDCADIERLDLAKQELMGILQEPEMKDAALLVYANKQDLQGAIKPSELASKLDLPSVKDRQWFVQSACATSGDGLHEGMIWLADVLTGSKRN